LPSSKIVSNSLINEKSPYLLEHAYNPVDRYTWRDEAFFSANSKDKPVFLSVGYSCCHWWQYDYYNQKMENTDVCLYKFANFMRE
jgi:uncharacterized protein YyaL (SSP411 family)